MDNFQGSAVRVSARCASELECEREAGLRDSRQPDGWTRRNTTNRLHQPTITIELFSSIFEDDRTPCVLGKFALGQAKSPTARQRCIAWLDRQFD